MHALLGLCGSPGAIAGSLFLTALIGSLVHCLPMCGPFVLMQAGNPTDGPLLRRLGGALLLRYQTGRIATYVALGALAGTAGGWVVGEGLLRWAPAALLGVAAVAFLAQAAARVAALPAIVLSALSRPLANLIVPLAARRPGGFRLGLLLGLLPCGFLYAGLAAAAATGSALGGASAMAAFGLGTAPALVLVALTGRAALAKWRVQAAPALTFLLLFNALTLSAAALRLILV